MTKSSREKLNSMHIAGAIGIAAIFAGVTGSWLIFVLIAAGLISAGIATGEIRLSRHGIN